MAVACACVLEFMYVVLRVLVAIVLASELAHALALRSEPALVLVSGTTLAFAPHLALARVSVLRPVLVLSCVCKGK